MGLVSYVDILEVFGELADFKAKLLEGEGIAQKSGISELIVNERDKGVYEISAQCQPGLRDPQSDLFCVTITIVLEPRSLDCKCSCLDGKAGKCVHIVATLIQIHRNNLSMVNVRGCERKLDEEVGIKCMNKVAKGKIKCNEKTENSKEVVIPMPLQEQTSGEACGGIMTQNLECTVCFNLDQEHLQSIPLKVSDEEIGPQISPLEGNSFPEVSEHLNAVTSQDGLGNSPEILELSRNDPCKIDLRSTVVLVNDSRMGRGHRRAVPNRKYNSDPGKIFCRLCPKSFVKKGCFEEHIRSHSGEKPLVCENCGQRFSRKKTLLKHKKDKGCGGSPKFSCGTCQEYFSCPVELENHCLSHSSKKYFQCSDCVKSFSSKRGLDTHLRVHSKEKQLGEMDATPHSVDVEFMCDVCGKGFKKLILLTQHKSSHENMKPFKCSECGKCFSRQRTYDAHKHQEGESLRPSKSSSKPRSVIKCEICGKEFTNRMHHEEHVRSHTGERPFQCVECGKGFASKRSLRNHSHKGSKDRIRPYSCSLCPASFSSAFMLKAHERSHSDEKPFACAECGKAYRSQHVYQDHLNHHKGIKAHSCKECEKSFTWRTSLWAHMRDHSKDKPFVCIQCGAMFAEQLELKHHWEVHSSDKPHQCPDCGLGFTLETDRDQHLEIHKKSPSHACTKCDQTFMWAHELHRHMQTHKEKKKNPCPSCGQTFNSKGHLKVHMLIHTGVKPFECETCQKRFYTRSLLRKHTVFHSNERPYECALCGDKFPTQGILKAHIRTHTGERPYSCEECGKSFPQSTYLKRHILTHTGERPYPCSQCESAFASRYDLKIHTRTHTGEKPFLCSECGEKFYERAQLTVHKRSHSGERPFVCDICGKRFNSSNHVKKHFGRIHPDIAPFFCVDCGERFIKCEALRKHRKCSHLPGAEEVGCLTQQTETVPDEQTSESTSPENNKDPLNRLIEDSQILVEETSISSSASAVETDTTILTQEFEIVQVDLVDSSQLIKLANGYNCQTVEVYNADSLSGFEEPTSYQAVSPTPSQEQEESTAALPLSPKLGVVGSSSS